MENKKECTECAGNPVNHGISYCSALMSYLMRPVEKHFNLIGRIVDPITFTLFNRMIPGFTDVLVKLNLGHISHEPRETDSWKTRCMWEEAKTRGIKMYQFHPLGKVKGSFIAVFGDKIRSFDGLPRPSGPMSKAVAWMDDKGIMRRRFAKAGIPIAKGGVAFTKAGALKIFRKLSKPVIAKPSQGSRSRHTTIHINSERELIKAYQIAKQLSPWVVIEEELSGMVFRGTIVGGKIAAIMRREPPHIIGDGKNTVRALMDAENKNPKRHGPIFHEIPVSEDAESDLKRQNLTWTSVPAKGQLVTLGQKVGRTTGASTTDVTDIAHPENIKLLEKIYAVLKDPLVGVDFIIDDISKPWQSQKKCGVIECNSMPFIDLHHYPLYGEPRNVAGYLWDVVFPDSSPSSKS